MTAARHEPAASPTNLGAVQALRGLAAMLVVLYHATQMVAERLGAGHVLTFGASGVDLFFPISGFVMVLTTYRHWGKAGQARDFLLRRLARIVPLYWAATLLKVLALLALPAMASHPTLDAWHVVASFLFIPAWDVHHRAQPIVPVGWSLHFEMLFYLLFAWALWLRVRPLLWLSLVLGTICLLAPWRDALGAIGTLADPMLLEFVAGMFIGWATVRGRVLPVSVAAALLAAALLALPATEAMGHGAAYTWRALVWGVPGALALAAAVALEGWWQRHRSPMFERLGDASYAIYLVHGFVLPPLGFVLVRLGLNSGAWPLLAVLAACVASAWIGWWVHRWVERPLTERLIEHIRRQPVKAPEPTGA